MLFDSYPISLNLSLCGFIQLKRNVSPNKWDVCIKNWQLTIQLDVVNGTIRRWRQFTSCRKQTNVIVWNAQHCSLPLPKKIMWSPRIIEPSFFKDSCCRMPKIAKSREKYEVRENIYSIHWILNYVSALTWIDSPCTGWKQFISNKTKVQFDLFVSTDAWVILSHFLTKRVCKMDLFVLISLTRCKFIIVCSFSII